MHPLYLQLTRHKQRAMTQRADDLKQDRREYVQRMCRKAARHCSPVKWLSRHYTKPPS